MRPADPGITPATAPQGIPLDSDPTMRVAALPMFRPPKARAVEVACAPDASPDLASLPSVSFARVLGGSPGTVAVRAALDGIVAEGALVEDPEPRMFVYRAAHAGKRWMGLVCAVDTRDLLHLFPNAASDEEISAAQADLSSVQAQLLPALVTIDASPDLSYQFVCDTNERPAYHFVSADGSTHSAWEVHRPEPMVTALAELAAEEIRSGAAQVVAAHMAGTMPLAILTPDRDVAAAAGPLAPRCGLFVPRPARR